MIDSYTQIDSSDFEISENENNFEFNLKYFGNSYTQIVEKKYFSKYLRNEYIKIPLDRTDFKMSSLSLVFKRSKIKNYEISLYDAVSKKNLKKLQKFKIS